MKGIVASCGIICTECPAFLATLADDWDKLGDIAAKWSDDKIEHEAKDIICDGCFSERIHSFCSECEVRACAKDNGYQVCSQCSRYSCSKLERLWSSFTSYSADDLRKTLEQVKDQY
ncbi:MAG: DUF3795 domain-containing protein [Candidatus Thorarchaeota archaeon]